uniref:HMA domain-containing protein n=1 Tax=Salix viminalis TaxID=40686 RepID=A0A6N2NAB0_SALVM
MTLFYIRVFIIIIIPSFTGRSVFCGSRCRTRTVKVNGKVNPTTILNVLDEYGKHGEVSSLRFDGERAIVWEKSVSNANATASTPPPPQKQQHPPPPPLPQQQPPTVSKAPPAPPPPDPKCCAIM